ncbi:PP2C family protein-serine/threonine phosphatase [Streptomyces huiliensis]|uniref:PP2C family protein-serine/threonine phosphatase n=1 Tax=Streptomyces huiliensis TaxID=2876027 RepID=UPI001CBE1213|nr:PP2C family protein-serine/threonine phosphatase [Streptomyces huiliensis]MBZ4321356.1 serine/threonine-protein phosphatase [Streptomyces huiliensis]
MIRTRTARCRRGAVLVLPGLWVAGVVLWELLSPLGSHFAHLLAVAPAIACAGSGRRHHVLLGGGCALFALVPLGSAGRADPAALVGTCCAVLAVVAAAWLASHRGHRLAREVERLREIAATAQHAVLRPLPPRLAGLTLAGGHRSASEGALLGGDLYEVLATRHGVRLVIGDVRGHGLPALGTVAALLGSFREAAHDEDGLPGVLRRMERAFHRHLGDLASGQSPPSGESLPSGEDFATVLVLEIGAEGEVTALNCGHPWPHRLIAGDAGPLPGARAEVLSSGDPLPPLGMFPLPAEPPVRRLARLLPGEALVLHTDGVEDARDAAGRFFPLTRVLAEAAGGAPVVPAAVVERVRNAVLRHTGGVLADDFALLALRDDRHRVPGRAPHGPLARSCPYG